MDANSDPIVVELTFGVPPEAVWEAITDPVRMRQWFFEPIEEFSPEPGFVARFNVRNGDTDYLHVWTIIDVLPGERIVYDWCYEGLPGDSTVTWVLTETPDGTTLLLTHQVNEPFPADDPAFSRESGQAGWDYFIGERLKGYLEQGGA